MSKGSSGLSGGGKPSGRIPIENLSNQGLPDLKGTDKQIAWANDLREKWIEEQNEKLNLWGDTAVALVEARTKASQAAKAAGITYRDGEGSEIYIKAFEKEMKSRGFKSSYNEYQNTLENYMHSSSITSNFPVPIQKKAMKNLGLTDIPKTKEVKNRISLYREATRLYLQSEKKAPRWIDLRNESTRRVVYRNGVFEALG